MMSRQLMSGISGFKLNGLDYVLLTELCNNIEADVEKTMKFFQVLSLIYLENCPSKDRANYIFLRPKYKMKMHVQKSLRIARRRTQSTKARMGPSEHWASPGPTSLSLAKIGKVRREA
jgi:hypothetical protein